jgi:hypothetical protein
MISAVVRFGHRRRTGRSTPFPRRKSERGSKIANAGVAPRNMKLQSFNGRTESYPSGAHSPFASHVSHPEQKSAYQKYCGMFDLVWNGRFWSKVRRHHREHDYEHQGGPSRQPFHWQHFGSSSLTNMRGSASALPDLLSTRTAESYSLDLVSRKK